MLRAVFLAGQAVLLSGCMVAIDLSLLDGGAILGGDAEVVGMGRCPSDMLELPIGGGLCIDITEVTRGAYAEILATSPDPSGGLRTCDWNGSLLPAADWPPAQGTELQPVAFVDWCDAQVYCRARGKRLCGQIGGGPVDVDEAADPRLGEWAAACSKNGELHFPYGAAFESGRCNGFGGLGQAVPVESMAGCVGGYQGLYDLSGNVSEWQDACHDEGQRSSDDPCAFVGGSFRQDRDQLSCDQSSIQDDRSRVAGDRGFRCCKTP